MKNFLKISGITLWAVAILIIGYRNGNVSMAHAEDVVTPTSAIEQQMQQALKTLEKVLASRQPGVKLINPTVTTIDGIFQMQISEGPQIYVTADGSHFFIGSLYAVENSELVNVSERSLSKLRQQFLQQSIGESINFSPLAKTKAVLNVFTDTTCGYCRRLHNEMDELNALGIEVRYFAFPRSGVDTPIYDEMVAAWCSDNPQSAISTLKSGSKIKQPKTCNNPVAKHYKAASAFGVTGTPAILLEDGTLVPGYRPAAEYAKILGLN